MSCHNINFKPHFLQLRILFSKWCHKIFSSCSWHVFMNQNYQYMNFEFYLHKWIANELTTTTHNINPKIQTSKPITYNLYVITLQNGAITCINQIMSLIPTKNLWMCKFEFYLRNELQMSWPQPTTLTHNNNYSS